VPESHLQNVHLTHSLGPESNPVKQYSDSEAALIFNCNI
jgi:hypothetical protein